MVRLTNDGRSTIDDFIGQRLLSFATVVVLIGTGLRPPAALWLLWLPSCRSENQKQHYSAFLIHKFTCIPLALQMLPRWCRPDLCAPLLVHHPTADIIGR